MKVISYQTYYEKNTGKIVATCFADSKEDVTSEAIAELNLGGGTIIYTKALEIGVVDSEGSVNWSE